MTRGRALQKLLESEQRLRALLRRVQVEGRVDASSHDLGNALLVVVMYREMLVERPDDERELSEDIEKTLVYADAIFVRIDGPPAAV